MKKLSAFSEKEKQEILKKYKRWYVYYSHRNQENKWIRQTPIYLKINQTFKDFDQRYKAINELRNFVEKLLKQGFSPYQKSEFENGQPMYIIKSSLEFALKIKKNSISESSFTDYKSRVGQFISYLDKKGIANGNIADLSRKHINEYLNFVLEKSSPRNRNNTLAVLSAIFSILEEKNQLL